MELQQISSDEKETVRVHKSTAWGLAISGILLPSNIELARRNCTQAGCVPS